MRLQNIVPCTCPILKLLGYSLNQTCVTPQCRHGASRSNAAMETGRKPSSKGTNAGHIGIRTDTTSTKYGLGLGFEQASMFLFETCFLRYPVYYSKATLVLGYPATNLWAGTTVLNET